MLKEILNILMQLLIMLIVKSINEQQIINLRSICFIALLKIILIHLLKKIKNLLQLPMIFFLIIITYMNFGIFIIIYE